MLNKQSLKIKLWSPTHPVSKGATAYHDSVAYTAWHKENIKGLIKIANKIVKSDDVVIDFGAGTGSSAIYLLQELKPDFTLILVDNSPSWLGKAYDLLAENKNTKFLLLEKNGKRYMLLDELIDKISIDHVFSANTVHLIPNIDETFLGIYNILKNGGNFVFQSGNIIDGNRKKGVLMIDDSVITVHDYALEVIRTEKSFIKYRKDLEKRIEDQKSQQKFIFPDPRPIEYYLKMLKAAGFKNAETTHKSIKVSYTDWMNFLRVRRLQAGILPEIGGKNATEEEEYDRDIIITKAADKLFTDLKMHNPFANDVSFTTEWVYVSAMK